jgi:hypothetical protein
MDKPHIPHIHSQPNSTPLGKQLTHDVQPHSILQPVVRLTVLFDLTERSNSPCERSTQVHEHTWACRARPARCSHTVLVPHHISSVHVIGARVRYDLAARKRVGPPYTSLHPNTSIRPGGAQGLWAQRRILQFSNLAPITTIKSLCPPSPPTNVLYNASTIFEPT